MKKCIWILNQDSEKPKFVHKLKRKIDILQHKPVSAKSQKVHNGDMMIKLNGDNQLELGLQEGWYQADASKL